jgi:hypothetical protein
MPSPTDPDDQNIDNATPCEQDIETCSLEAIRRFVAQDGFNPSPQETESPTRRRPKKFDMEEFVACIRAEHAKKAKQKLEETLWTSMNCIPVRTGINEDLLDSGYTCLN